MKTSIAELQSLTERENKFRCYERMAEYHSTGKTLDGVVVGEQRFDLVLADKWGMLTYSDSNPFLGGY